MDKKRPVVKPGDSGTGESMFCTSGGVISSEDVPSNRVVISLSGGDVRLSVNERPRRLAGADDWRVAGWFMEKRGGGMLDCCAYMLCRLV